MKQAQVSTFILVGVVVLIIVFFFMIIFSLNSNDDLESTQIEQANVDELRSTMQFCLEQESEQAIYNLGLQGGNIYNYQGGFDELSQTLPYTLGNQTRFVRYGITRADNEPIVPFYPVAVASQQGNYYTLSYLETHFGGLELWGKNVMRKLCDPLGPNSVDNPDKRLSCELFTYDTGEQNSIQYALQETIKTNLDLCIERQQNDFNERIGGFEYNITFTEVVIGNNEVQVNAQANFLIAQEKITSKFDSLTYTVPVRLKRVYNLLYYVLAEETRDVHFDKSADYVDVSECNYPGTSNCWDNGMVVSVYRSPNAAFKGVDVLEIVDTSSNILGNPFRYLVAIENRRPMLDFFDYDTLDPIPNIVLTEDVRVNITPIAYDPDEDELTFYYSYDGDWVKSTSFEQSDLYVDGIGCQSSSQCASLESNTTGAFTFEIRVEDDNKLYDFQEVFVKSYGANALSGGWHEAIDMCPAYRSGYTTVICDSDDCVCESGEYCIDARPQEDTILTCERGSYCCSTKTTGNLYLDCSDRDTICDAKSTTGSLNIDCYGEDAHCRAESNSLITRNCEGNGVLCEMSSPVQPVTCSSLAATCVPFDGNWD